MGRFSGKFSRILHHCVSTILSSAFTYAETTTSTGIMEPAKDEMIKGLAIGFGLFFGAIIVLCVVCCLCCNSSCRCCCCKEKERHPRRFPRKMPPKIGPSPTPSPPRSGTITRSTMMSSRSGNQQW